MTTTTNKLIDLTDSRINEYLTLWHENGRDYFESHYKNLDYGRDYFESHYKNLDYDRDYPKHASLRRKYICLDDGSSGCLLVDRATGIVYTIKSYGTKNRPVGTLDELIADMRDANEHNRMVRHG